MTCDSAYRLQSCAWSRPNVVSVLIGYRFLEKIMFSFQTLRVGYSANCEIFAKISYYVTNAFVSFFWNLAILFSNSSPGSEKLKQNRHSLIKSRLTDLNNFIRMRVTAKSNDFTSLLFNGQHSKPYNKIGKHLHLTNSRTTSSEASLQIFPKIALVARKKSALGLVQRALERPWFDKVHPEVPNFLHHGKLRPVELAMTAELLVSYHLLHNTFIGQW